MLCSRLIRVDIVAKMTRPEPPAESISAWLDGIPDKTHKKELQARESRSVSADTSRPTVRQVDRSLKSIGVKLPHTMALMEHLEQADENSCSQSHRQFKTGNTTLILPSAAAVNEPRITAGEVYPSPASTMNSSRAREQTVRSVRSRFSTVARASDSKFTDLMGKLAAQRPRGSLKGSTTSRTEVPPRFSSLKEQKEDVSTWRTIAYPSLKHSELTQSKERRLRQNVYAILAGSRSVKGQTCIQSTVAKGWQRTYRDKSVNRVQIPACFKMSQ